MPHERPSRGPREPGTSVRADLEARLTRVRGLTPRRSRRGDDPCYCVGDQEVAHFHGAERVDVRLTRERISALRADGAFDARVTTRGPSAQWVAVRLRAPSDAEYAVHWVEEAVRAHTAPAASHRRSSAGGARTVEPL